MNNIDFRELKGLLDKMWSMDIHDWIVTFQKKQKEQAMKSNEG